MAFSVHPTRLGVQDGEELHSTNRPCLYSLYYIPIWLDKTVQRLCCCSTKGLDGIRRMP